MDSELSNRLAATLAEAAGELRSLYELDMDTGSELLARKPRVKWSDLKAAYDKVERARNAWMNAQA